MSSHHSSNLSPANLEIYVQQGQWIVLNGGKALWLPLQARPSYSAIKANMLAMGYLSSNISVIRNISLYLWALLSEAQHNSIPIIIEKSVQKRRLYFGFQSNELSRDTRQSVS